MKANLLCVAVVAGFSQLVTVVARTRTFTVHNNCLFTICTSIPQIFTDLNVGSATPNQPNGWQQAAFSTLSFSVPDNWRAGRIWGRRDCNFDTNPGPNSCLDGGCNGGLVCDPHTGTGVPPATVAEFNLGVNGVDNYDVSVVDGFNLPLRIQTSNQCPLADCPVNLVLRCPAQLQGPFESNGSPVGCRSACDAGLGGDRNNNPNCCTGQYNSPTTCPSSGVQFYSYFKSNCPNSIVYAYDSPSVDRTCGGSPDYTITFCP
ncbi:thaumatin [Trametes elegans]|nr:thaumatin [Trametes elegans]